MRLCFLLGNNPDLAKKEIEATATILPFLWSATMLHPGIYELKSRDPMEWEDEGISGFLSQKAEGVRESIAQLQKRLGGTVKIVWLIGEQPAHQVSFWLASELRKASEARWQIGVSFLWGKGPAERIGLEAKRLLKEQGMGMRYVPLAGPGMSASLLHNKLALDLFTQEKPGVELNLIASPDGHRYIVGFTLTVQDIESYTKRDFGIPVSDAVSGMLPPKLAQTMLNFALAGQDPATVDVYDPFCGNGRILLETYQMGGQAYGSDIAQEKVAASQKNLEWAVKDGVSDRVWRMDATSKNAPAELASRQLGKRPFVIVAEPYLGKPQRGLLSPADATQWLGSLEPLYLQFLQVWAEVPVSQRPQQMVLVFPVAHLKNGRRVPLLATLFDRIVKIGYSPERLSHYSRPDAVIGRDIVLLKVPSL